MYTNTCAYTHIFTRTLHGMTGMMAGGDRLAIAEQFLAIEGPVLRMWVPYSAAHTAQTRLRSVIADVCRIDPVLLMAPEDLDAAVPDVATGADG